MSNTELFDRTLTDVTRLVAERQVSPVELMDLTLRRIDETKETNAFISVFADEARKAARSSENRIAAGHRDGPLHGIPLVLKDNIQVQDHVTTAGSKVLKLNHSSTDATVVQRLRAAGAIVVAKTNMNEFAWGFSGINPHYGDTTNPWDSTKISGGSSSGSAVALATRISFGALGTDTGGSARVPAALSGVTSLRPTSGRVSNSGVIPLAWSMDTVAPMARTAADCSLLLTAMTGRDRSDSAISERLEGSSILDGDVNSLRIGLVKEYSLRHLQDSVRQTFLGAVETLRIAGFDICTVSIAEVDVDLPNRLIPITAESYVYHQCWLHEYREEYSDFVRRTFESGSQILATQYIQLEHYRERLRSQTMSALSEADVLICPTVPFTAITIGEAEVEIDPGKPEDMFPASMQFTALPSLTGLPAISVPCGFDEAGLPIGMQIIGRPFTEELLMRLAERFQQITSFHLRKPADAAEPRDL